MFTSYLLSEAKEVNMPKDLAISKNRKANGSINEKYYLGRWESKGHKIYLYKQYHKLLAVIQDMSEKTIILSSENIKGGISGKMPQNVLFKMIKYDQERIALTIHKNQNNHLTLWIIPKLEAAGRIDELAIKKANEYEKQARENVSLYKKYYNKNNFDDACNQCQKALSQYQRAYNIKKKNGEDTQAVEAAISVLRKEFFLFKLDQKMAFYLPDHTDQDEVREIFDPFIKEEDVFALTFEMAESTPEEQRSKAENFTCAYSSEFLGNYTKAIKSYLLLSVQYYENEDQIEDRNQSLSNFCSEKAFSLFKETIQTSDSLNIAKNIEDFLEEIDVDWLNKTINNIPCIDYFKSLIEENQLKKIAYEFVKKTQEESNKYTTHTQNEETFKNVCKAYEDAICHLQIAYNFIKKNKSSTQEVEADINKLQKELFEFKIPYAMNLYLPLIEDQNEFRKNLSLLGNEANLSSIMTKLIENLTKEQRSLVDNFTCAYAYEYLDNPILAVQHYLCLSQQYINNSNPSLFVKCLKKAESLIKEKTESSDPFAMANFLEMLDSNHLEEILKKLPADDPNVEYLKKTLLNKDSIRITFEEHLHGLGKLYPRSKKPTCFICFNVEESDVGNWLENTLVPDLDRMGIEPIFRFRELGPGQELNVFQGLIRESNLVIIVCTPLLKKKCYDCRKMPIGVAQEIRIALERYNDEDKYETIYPLYLKGDRKSSCPSVFLEPIVGAEFSILDKNTEFSVFTYYSNAFELFGSMHGITIEKSREVKEQFLSEAKNIMSGDQVDMDQVASWRENHISRNKILLKSISYNIATKTKVIDFPPPPQDFTGRQSELNNLHEYCKNNNSVVITGLGGIGKTSLALKYADEYKFYYKFIYFITAVSQDSIVQGLIDLADKMNIPQGKIPIRLKNLRNQLHEFDGDYLIIFDGIDNSEAFEELKKHLPNNKKCILLTSRMIEYSRKLYCKPLLLTSWCIEEAVEYLLTTTKKEEAGQAETTKSNEHNQAKVLAEKLGCLPLALVHASAYIRTRNYTICKYIEQFEQYEVKLFEKEHFELAKEEKTILTTWQITLNEIESYHKCSIAKPILDFFSFFGQAPIPLIVIEHWFKTFFCNHSELELGDGLSHLYNYSMIDNPYPEFYAVHLSVQNVIRYHLSFDEYQNNLVQVLKCTYSLDEKLRL